MSVSHGILASLNMSHNNNQESEMQLCENKQYTEREPEQSPSINGVEKELETLAALAFG